MFSLPSKTVLSSRIFYILFVSNYCTGVVHFFTYRERKIIPDSEQMFYSGMIIPCPFSVVKRGKQAVYFLWDNESLRGYRRFFIVVISYNNLPVHSIALRTCRLPKQVHFVYLFQQVLRYQTQLFYHRRRNLKVCAKYRWLFCFQQRN